MKYIKFFLFILTFLFLGCSNTKLSLKYKYSNNYEKIYDGYYELAEKGFPKASYKLSKMIYSSKVNRPAKTERKYALYAYNNGIKEAALIVADSYVRDKNYKQALIWLNKIKFENYSVKDFKNLITCIENMNEYKRQIYYLSILNDYAKKSENPGLLAVLGEFYLNESPFFNEKAGIEFLKKAYDKGVYQAGAVLGIYFVKHNRKKEGYKLLKEVITKDSKAAYYLGNALYDEMVTKEKEMNSGCISCSFTTAEEFYVKKLTIYKFNDIFTNINIKKAYLYSYDMGEVRGLYKLIRLDIEDNRFETNSTYSGFDLNSSVSFLNSRNDVESKLILAKIYEKYPQLHSLHKAKEIYYWYEKINKLQAYWHLYQYEKKFENFVNFKYLNYVADKEYVPAIIERAYQELMLGKNISENRKILEKYAAKDNILALNYLGSLYANKVFMPKSKSFIYYKRANILENKPFNIPSEDLKIANYYQNDLNDLNKALSIYYYYAQLKNITAMTYMVNFYKSHCNYKKMKYWLFELRKKADTKALGLYYSMVLQNYVDGNYTKAIEYFSNAKDAYSYIVLGDVYAEGYYKKFDPEKALQLYEKAFRLGYNPALYKIITLLEKINVNHKYDKKIKRLYFKAIALNLPDAKIRLAKFYMSKSKKKKALSVLKSIKDQSNPKLRYMLYQLTGNIKYIRGKNCNYGYLLLAKAENITKKNPKKALYYTFRAMLCNTPGTTKTAMTLMKKINNSSVIRSIYNKAKAAPKCRLY